jgi:hypothetical protein
MQKHISMEALMQEPPASILDAIIPNYQPILDIMKESWSLWHDGHSKFKQKLLHYRPKNRAIGSDMSDILRATFKEKCENGELPNFKFIEKDKLWFIIIDESFVIRFNIMDDEGMTVRTYTQQSRKYRDNQMRIEGFDNLEYLYGGYILDQSKSEIEKFYILKRNENEVPIWVIDQRHNVVTQPEIEFDTPARRINIQEEEVKPRRASVRKKLDTASNDDNTKTGSNDA